MNDNKSKYDDVFKRRAQKINRINDDQSNITKRYRDKMSARIYREKKSKSFQERESLLNIKEKENKLLKEDVNQLEQEVKICKNIHERIKLVNNFVQCIR